MAGSAIVSSLGKIQASRYRALGAAVASECLRDSNRDALRRQELWQINRVEPHMPPDSGTGVEHGARSLLLSR
jgi:hypothetical protein